MPKGITPICPRPVRSRLAVRQLLRPGGAVTERTGFQLNASAAKSKLSKRDFPALQTQINDEGWNRQIVKSSGGSDRYQGPQGTMR
jgi:hypothetical protein